MAVENVTVQIGDSPISFETGKLAKQANGSVVVRSGDTVILVTAVGAQSPRPGADFFPLTVDVEERMYAAGKIPGGFIKRESRPSDPATLTARMTDRPIRPLWPKGYRNETQVVATILSVDQVNAFDILALNGASMALMLSEMPFQGPVGAVRIGLMGDEFIINPTLQEAEESELDLVVAGTATPSRWSRRAPPRWTRRRCSRRLQIAQEEIRTLLRRPDRAADEGRQAQVGRRADRRGREAGRQGREVVRQGPRRGNPRAGQAAATRQGRRRAGRRPPEIDPRCRPRPPRPPPTSAAPSTRSRRRSSAAASLWRSTARTAARPTRSVRSPPRSGSCRACTAPACSPAARPRC